MRPLSPPIVRIAERVGKRSWLSHDEGASIPSLIQSAKLNGHDWL